MFYMIEFYPFIYTLNEHSEITNSYFKTGSIESNAEDLYTDNSKITDGKLKHIE